MNCLHLSALVRCTCIVGAAGLLSACGLFKSTGDNYYKAEPLSPIKIPEGMETTSLEPLYVVPDVPPREDELLLARDYGSYEVPRPDPLPTDGATESGVKIQRLGDVRWILVDAPTSQIWPQAQRFLSQYGIGVAVNDPASGMIETDWVRFKEDDAQKHRYRIWIEHGLRPDTTEVHVVQRQVPEAFSDPDLIEWTRTSENAERAGFILDELAAELAAEAKNSSASLLGQRVGGQAKSDIAFVEGEPVLRLRLSYDRAWATVMHSLGQEQFALWGSDIAKGVALVGHLIDAHEVGFFGRLFGRDELPEDAPAGLSDVLDQLASAPEVKALFDDVPGTDYGSPRDLDDTYLVVVKAVNGTTSVYVRAADGSRLSPRVARKILTTIRRNLI